MKRHILATAVSALALAAAPGSALAQPGDNGGPPGSGTPGGLIKQSQSAGNINETTQSSQSNPSTEQTNVNVPVSILSAGSNNGNVDQSNNSKTSSTAENNNGTGQSNDQTQSGSAQGGSGSVDQDQQGAPATIVADQGAQDDIPTDQSPGAENYNSTEQQAQSDPSTSQTNVNAPISIASYGSNDGNVKQSNNAATSSSAQNNNGTGQSNQQSQNGSVGGQPPQKQPCPPQGGNGGKPGDPKGNGSKSKQSQSAFNENSTDQQAESDPSTQQENVNAPISVLSIDANNGDVHQSNNSWTSSKAENNNGTGQSNQQSQNGSVQGYGQDGKPGDPKGNGSTSKQDQSAFNDNSTDQQAESDPSTQQTNVNIPVSILSADSNNGNVDQSNNSKTSSTAENNNGTGQSNQQSQNGSVGGQPPQKQPCPPQGGNGGGQPPQKQPCPPQGGNGGAPQGSPPGGSQGSGAGKAHQSQSAFNENCTDQQAESDPSTQQENVNAPISVLSIDANNGDVHQSNNSWTSSKAENNNGTGQSNQQSQNGSVQGYGQDGKPGDPKGNGSTSKQDQTAGNGNGTYQQAVSDPSTEQENANIPVSFLSIDSNNSGGNDPSDCGGEQGGVSQSNNSGTLSKAVNNNGTGQSNDQQQGSAV